MGQITFCLVLLCFVLNVECVSFHGQPNTTSTSSGQPINNMDSQIRHLQTVLDSVLMVNQQQQKKDYPLGK
jgi:hypothetical protein